MRVSNIAIMMSLIAQTRKSSGPRAQARTSTGRRYRGPVSYVRPGETAITNAEFSALATSWHDFYLTAGAAAAALIGLLFVGVSINLDEFTADEGTGIRLLAEQAFSNFVWVLLIALFVLGPDQDSVSLAIELAIVGGLGTVRVLQRVAAFRRRTDRFLGSFYAIRRLGLPGAASIGLIAVAALLASNPISSFYWLLGVVLVYLTSAADSAWDLLVEVGRERRRTH